MQKRCLIFGCTLLLLLAAACETDFNIAAPWKEIPIVYGLLDPSKPAQYIRVTKAFLGEEINANTVAQMPDSSDLAISSIVLEEHSSPQFSGAIQTIALQKVDAMQEGLQKEDGAFYTEPYYLYKVAQPLNDEHAYKLLITTEKGTVLTAQTSMVEGFDILRPTAVQELNLRSAPEFIVRWKKSDNAAFYDVDVIVHFFETRTDTPQPVEKTVKIDLITGLENNNTGEPSISVDILVDNFLNALVRAFPTDDPAVIQRDFDPYTFDFLFHAGNEELKKYNEVSGAQLSIAASQNTLEYTNVEGGKGLLASRITMQAINIPLERESYPIIACNPITQHLKFVIHPNDPTYPVCP